MSVPAPSGARHDGGRWETVRYAVDSWARTFRLCLILLVRAISPVAAAVAVVLIHHMLLRGWSGCARAGGMSRAGSPHDLHAFSIGPSYLPVSTALQRGP